MGIACDVIVILILAGSVYRGYKKGIVDIGFKLVAFIVSILVALILYSPITNLIIYNTDIDEKIEDAIVRNRDENTENSEEDESSYVTKATKEVTKNVQNSIAESTAKPIARKAIALGVMVILFIFSRIILMVLKIFTDIVTKIPVIKQLNEVAGLAYGLLVGLIIIYAIFAIIFFLISIGGNINISEFIGKTIITKFFYDNNLILKFLIK